jgi:hypothetical protein
MPSPMRGDHGETSRIVAGWLWYYQWKTLGIRGADGATLKLDLHGEPQPDHMLRIPPEMGGQSCFDAQGYIAGAAELVVEVARSSRAFDLKQKKADYESAGVREYIVVELDPNRIHWLVRRGVRFVRLRPGPDRIYRSKVFPGLWLDPEALYAGDLNRLIHVLEEGLATPEHADFVARLADAGNRTGKGG